MAGSFVVRNGDTTITFVYTSTTEKVLATVTDAAHYLWNTGRGDHGTEANPILFKALTTQQKLNIVDAYLRQTVLDMARTYSSIAAQDAARLLAEQTSVNIHI